MQFADDVTESVTDMDAEVVVTKLSESFQKTKEFCAERELAINASMTQLVLFKSTTKRVPADIVIHL